MLEAVLEFESVPELVIVDRFELDHVIEFGGQGKNGLARSAPLVPCVHPTVWCGGGKQA